MDRNNFFLELLNKLNRDLKGVILKRNDYSENVYNCIVAGIIIKMNTLIESHMIHFSSDEFKICAQYIYDARQLVIHYSDYRELQDLDDIAINIVKKIDKASQKEVEFSKKVFEYTSSNEYNVVVEKSRRISYDKDSNCYIFRNEDVVISVSADKIIRIQDLNKNKDIAYIVNCENDMNYFYKDGEEMVYQQLAAPMDLQDFFARNFNVLETDYSEHKETINDILDNFYKSGNYGNIYVQQIETHGYKKLSYLERGKVLSEYVNNNILYHQFLKYRRYKSIDVPQEGFENYKQIRTLCSEYLENNITKRDYYFIVKTISGFDNLNNILNGLKEKKEISEREMNYLKTTMLVNWTDNMVRNMNTELVANNESFKQIYNKLISYRTFFAHNPLQLKTDLANRKLDEFYELAKGYISILSGLNIKDLSASQKEIIDFVAIISDKKRFFNDKHRQYIQVDPTTYIGEKLFYSNMNDENSMIALVPVEKNFPLRGAYYQRKNDEFIPITFKDKKLMVSKVNCKKGVETCMDINIDDLLYLFAAYKGKIEELPLEDIDCPSCKKLVLFEPSERNQFKSHAISLTTIIDDYFSQRYLPYELVRETKILHQYNDAGKIEFAIVDKDNNLIAKIVDKNQLDKLNIKKDKSFSIKAK